MSFALLKQVLHVTVCDVAVVYGETRQSAARAHRFSNNIERKEVQGQPLQRWQMLEERELIGRRNEWLR